jgi:hypothetical protein
MKRFACLLPVAVTLTLAMPALAQAKGVITAARLCGAATCHPVRGRADLVALTRLNRAAEAGASRAAVPSLQGYLVIRAEPRRSFPTSHPVYYLPGAHLVSSSGAWLRVPATLDAHLRASAAGLTLLRPSPLRLVTDGRMLPPFAARLLFGGMTPVAQAPADVFDGPFLPIAVRSSRGSPWTAEGTPISYFPAARLLQVGSQAWFRPPERLARALRTAAGRPPPRASGPGGSYPGRPLAIVAAAAVLLGGLTAARRWRRGHQYA